MQNAGINGWLETKASLWTVLNTSGSINLRLKQKSMPMAENSSAIYHLCGMKHSLKEMGRQRQKICYHKGEY